MNNNNKKENKEEEEKVKQFDHLKGARLVYKMILLISHNVILSCFPIQCVDGEITHVTAVGIVSTANVLV